MKASRQKIVFGALTPNTIFWNDLLDHPPPEPKIFEDRVVLLEMQAQHADRIYAQVVDASLAQAKFLVVRAGKLETRLRQMAAALALVRKLGTTTR